ncbi:flavodoxin family protein [Acetobacterium sp.]|uniref:flavodoxin family protein n=1 Tax=Acetobacterium sp. TaxID=1872094 RepID=UPI0035944FFB
MKIGIILYSYSGNTLSVGERLKVLLLKKGHEVSLKRIKASDEAPNSGKPIQLTEIPDTSQYDEIILGAPVRAFSLNPIMKAYLAKLPDLQGKKISCFVTEHFPKAWMGGNHAIKQIKRMVSAKNGNIADCGVVNWSNAIREEQINEMLSRFSS